MRQMKTTVLIITAMSLLLLTACGNDKNTKIAVPSISIAPTTLIVEAGQTATLTVNAQNTGITWPTLSSAQGSYTQNGNVATYTAPIVTETTTVQFTVTAAADTTKTATATITVQPLTVEESFNVMGRADTPDGSPLADTEFVAEVYVPTAVVSQFSSLSSVNLDGWTRYTINTYSTDENGYYYLSLPSEGDYLVQLLFEDYDDFVQYISITDVNRVEEMEPVVLVPDEEGEGKFVGTLRDATTDYTLPGVTIEVRQNWNNTSGVALETISSNSSGVFEIDLPYGYYTFYASLDGYIRAVMNVSVYADEVVRVYHMNPVYEGEYRIVLTWGQDPRDLDSYLLASGVYLYYSDRHHPDDYAYLDIDVTNGYGPETFTIYNLEGLGGIRYAVHDYTNRGTGSSNYALSASNAIVRVYKGESLTKTYYVPVNSPGTTWYVFEMSADGVITDLNTFGFSYPDEY